MMKLETATEILDAYKPQDAGEYRIAFLDHLKRNNRKEQPQPGALKAAIDCGRWVVDCQCGSGIALHPRWQIAACFLCGRSWWQVEFPAPYFLDQLEEIFRLRPAGSIHRNPQRFWSWKPTETREDLVEENRTHGWQVPKGAF